MSKITASELMAFDWEFQPHETLYMLNEPGALCDFDYHERACADALASCYESVVDYVRDTLSGCYDSADEIEDEEIRSLYEKVMS